MANTKGAKKAARVSKRRELINKSIRDSFKNARKEVLKAAGSKASKTDVSALYTKFQSKVDTAAKKGLIKANTAGRYKSRVVTKLKTLGF